MLVILAQVTILLLTLSLSTVLHVSREIDTQTTFRRASRNRTASADQARTTRDENTSEANLRRAFWGLGHILKDGSVDGACEGDNTNCTELPRGTATPQPTKDGPRRSSKRLSDTAKTNKTNSGDNEAGRAYSRAY